MKTILITGGTRGIGLATALRFSENDWNVYITSRKDENLTEVLNNHPNLKGFVANADSEEAAIETCENIVKETESLDVLINNAGTNIPEHFLKVRKQDMEKVVKINTIAAFNVANLVALKMTEAKNRMINLLSIFGGGRNTGYDLNTK